MAKTLQKKQEEALAKYVIKRKQLNDDIKPKIPKINAKKLRKDPKSFAYDVIEASFIKYIPSFVKSYKAGIEFGEAVKKNIDEDKENI